MAINLPNIFMTPELGGDVGLLNDELQKQLQQQATKAGLLTTAVDFLTAPRTRQAGSFLPYAGTAFTKGMQTASNVYGTGLQQAIAKQLKEPKMYTVDGALVDAQGNVVYKSPEKPEKSPFAAIDTTKYTPQSLREFQLTNDYSKLIEKDEIKQPTYAQAADRYAKQMFGGKLNTETNTRYPINATIADLNPNDVKDVIYEQRKSELDDAIKLEQEKSNLLLGSKEWELKTADTIRQQYNKEIKDAGYRELEDSFRKIQGAINSNTPIGDVASAVSIMKLLDPGSVVRESELEVAMRSSGLWDRMTNFSDRTLKGRKLTDQQRVEFEALAKEFYNTAKQTKAEIDARYLDISQQYNIDPRLLGIQSIKGLRVYNPKTGQVEVQ